MRGIFVVLFILMFCLTTHLCAKTIQEFGKWEVGENLLENSGFENDTNAWTLEDGAGGDRNCVISWAVEKKNPHLGKCCLHLTCNKVSGVGWHAKVRHDSSSMEAGKQFTIAFYARIEKPRTVSISVQMQRDPWTFYEGGDIRLDSEEWKEYSHTFAATADVTNDMWVGLAIAQEAVDFWLDDFRFFEGELKDELEPPGGEPETVNPAGKLTTVWGRLKRADEQFLSTFLKE